MGSKGNGDSGVFTCAYRKAAASSFARIAVEEEKDVLSVWGWVGVEG